MAQTKITSRSLETGAALANLNAGASVVFTPLVTLPSSSILNTPASITLTNATGLPISTGVSGLAANVATFLATPTSANLAAALTDETGNGGGFVRANNATLTTPTISGIVNLTYSDASFNNGFNVRNTDTSSSAVAGYALQNSAGTTVGGFQYVAANFINASLANSVLFTSTGAQKLGFVANSGSSTGQDISFQVSGTASASIVIRGSNGNVGIGTATANDKAILDCTSTSKGFLPPRMTTAQCNNISSPPEGLIIHDLNTGTVKSRDSSGWRQLFSSRPNSITSADLASAMTDETGFGSLVFNSSATLYSTTFSNSIIYGNTLIESNDSGIRKVHYATAAPTVNASSVNGYAVGCLWYMQDDTAYICRDNTTGAAVWEGYNPNAPQPICRNYNGAGSEWLATYTALPSLAAKKRVADGAIYIRDGMMCESITITGSNDTSGNMDFSHCPCLTTFSIIDVGVVAIDVGACLDISSIAIDSNALLETLRLPSNSGLLTLSITDCPAYDAHSLGMASGYVATNLSLLTSLTLENVYSNNNIDSFTIENFPALTTLSLSNVTGLYSYTNPSAPLPLTSMTIDNVDIFDYSHLMATIDFSWCVNLSYLEFRNMQPNFTNFGSTVITTLKLISCDLQSFSVALPTTLITVDLTDSNLGQSSSMFTSGTSMQILRLDGTYMTGASTVNIADATFVNLLELYCAGTTINIITDTSSCTNLQQLDLSNTALNLDVTANTALTHLYLSGWTGQDVSGTPSFDPDLTNNPSIIHLNAYGCAMSNVDAILVLLDTTGLSYGYLNLSGGTNAAPTGGASNAEVLSLQGKGWTVLHN